MKPHRNDLIWSRPTASFFHNRYGGNSLPSEMIALEPRVMLDGAAALAAVDPPAEPSTDGNEATQGSTADEPAAQSGNSQPAEGPEVSGNAEAGLTSGNAAQQNIVIVDAAVTDAATLLEGIDPSTEIYYLSSGTDGVHQITDILAGLTNVASLHILSHGAIGSVTLGSTTLNSSNIESYASQFVEWDIALSDGADILLYGCNVGRDHAGMDFIDLFAELANADVAASSDLTASRSLGGDWYMEVSTGAIESTLPLNAAATENYSHILSTGPSVLSFTRDTPATSPTGADTLTFLASFSEDVAGVDVSDFAVSVNGGINIEVTGVTQLTGSTYEVTLSGGNLATLNGNVGLNLALAPTITSVATSEALMVAEPAIDEIYTLVNIPPAVPANLDLAPESDTGASSTDNFTSDPNPIITGTADPGSIITLAYSGLRANGVADQFGNWSIMATGIPDGPVNISARATNAEGNSSAFSAPLRVTIERDVSQLSNLDGGGTFTENGAPTVIDENVRVRNPRYDGLGNGRGDYTGASFTFSRAGGANADDVFGFQSRPNFNIVNNEIVNQFGAFATIEFPGDGTVRVVFTGRETGGVPTQFASSAMRAITYSNSSDSPPDSVTLNLDFRDDNQFSGVGTTQAIINIAAVNDPPIVTGPAFTLNATEGVGLNIHNAGFSVAESDEAGGIVTATLQAGEGVLSLAAGNSGVMVAGGNDSGLVTLSGTIAQINTLLTGASTGTIVYLNNLDAPASSTVLMLTVNDRGNTGTDPGQSSDPTSEEASVSATINISPVNDAPSNLVPGPQTTDEETALVFSAATNNFLSVEDPDAGNGQISTQLSVEQGTLEVAPGSGAAIAGDGTDNVTVTGTLAEVNAAIANVIYIPLLNFAGSDTLTMTTIDRGNSGSGPALSDTDLVTITVNQVNDAPTGRDATIEISATTPHVFTAADFGFSDANDNPANNLREIIITTLPAGALIFNGTPVIANQEILAGELANLVYTRPVGEIGLGADRFTFQVRDDGGTDNNGQDTDQTPNTITFDIAESASLVVTTAADAVDRFDGVTSLREALAVAQNDDAISFDNSVFLVDDDIANNETIDLVQGELVVSQGVRITGDINGDGFADVTVDGDDATRVFNVASGTANVTLDGLVIQNGNSGTSNGGGLLINNNATVAVTNSAIINNYSGNHGGGIYNDGDLTLDNSTISDNSAGDRGGGIFNALATVVVTSSTISDNTAIFGGGIFNSRNFTINSSMVSGNMADTGGGVDNRGNFGINNSTISGNSSQGYGGGIYISTGADLTLNNSTVSGNIAGSLGGGLLIFGGNASVNNSIIAGNGAGIQNDDVGFVLVFSADSNGANIFGSDVIFNTGGDIILGSDYTLADVFADVGTVTVGGVSVTAGLLADNGGPVQTIALNQTGIAVDTGLDGFNVSPIDARGFDRNVDLPNVGNDGPSLDVIDIGAFEVQPPPTAQDDVFDTDEDTILNGNVLFDNGNGVDVDPSGGTLTVRAENFTTATGAMVNIAADGSFSYTPAINFNGTDSFTYTLISSVRSLDTGSVTINVNPVNDAPAGSDRTIVIESGAPRSFSAADFGFSDAGDTPPDAIFEVVITTVPTGALTLNGMQVTAGQRIPEGEFANLAYTRPGGVAGFAADSFRFQVRDNGGTDNNGQDTDQSPNTISFDIAEEASLVVTTDQDIVDRFDGVTSLREALVVSRNGDAITFDSDVFLINDDISDNDLISLTLGELVISQGIRIAGDIDGDGNQDVTLDGDNTSRIFNVASGTANVTLDGLVIQGGNSGAADGGGILVNSDAIVAVTNSAIIDNFAGYDGGGIYSVGALTLENTTIAGNDADGDGGGIRSGLGLTVVNSTIAENYAGSDGGGIYSEGTLTITGSTINDNEAHDDGGGIYNAAGIAIVSDSTVRDNEAHDDGGGIRTFGELTLTNSTVSNNEVQRDGGGIRSDGVLNIIDSTISDNDANDDAGGIRFEGTLEITNSTISDNFAGNIGGAIRSDGTLTVTGSTISGNEARDSGGGIYHEGGLATLTNSILRDNEAGDNGGGILSDGDLTITDSTISDNEAQDDGGGIRFEGTLTITNSTISSNSAGDDGGGIKSDGALTIIGSTISGNEVNNSGGGVSHGSGIATLTNSIVRDNEAEESGGGIRNYGVLMVTNSTVSGNDAAEDGGGIHNDNIATITDSTISDNLAELAGGGIRSERTLTITGSTISNNRSDFNGGGIYAEDDLAITNSTISENEAANDGGGVMIHGGSNTAVTDSMIIGNSAGQSGGGIYTDGDLTLNRTTLADNVAAQGGGLYHRDGDVQVTGSAITGNGAEFGGGLASFGGAIAIVDSDISDNRAFGDSDSGGGGIANDSELTLINSTINGNSAGQGGGILNYVGGTAIITGSIITNNMATGDIIGGGGILNLGELELTDSIVSGNSAAHGGGLANREGATTISGTTISNNMANGFYSGSGGGIVNDSDLTIANTTIRGNTAFSGAGLQNDNGTAAVSGSLIIDNQVLNSGSYGGFGGGIVNRNELILADSTVSGNIAGNGGGIANLDGLATITGSTISNNQAFGGSYGGGGIFIADNLSLVNSTVSGNSSTSDGGGIRTYSGTTNVTGATISGNAAAVRGGGIHNDAALNLYNATITGNRATFSGGGLYNVGDAAIGNSVVAGNSAGIINNDVGEEAGSIVNSNGANIFGLGVGAVSRGDIELGFGSGADRLTDVFANVDVVTVGGASFVAGRLADNGGPVATVALNRNGIAVDAGRAGVTSTSTDPRGFLRNVDIPGTGNNSPSLDIIDIGAFEVQELPTAAEDAFVTVEETPLAGNVLIDNGNGPDTDPNGILSVLAETVITTNGGTVVLQADGSFTYTPATDFDGIDSFSYTLIGSGGPNVGTANVTVTPVNDAPVNTVPGPQITDEDIELVFSAANRNQLSIADIDARSGQVSAVLSVGSGALSVAAGGGAIVTDNGTNSVTILGTVAQVNAALARVSYSPALDFVGNDTLTLVTNDNGNTGTGNTLTDTDSVAITINPVNDAPVNSVPGPQATDEDTALVLSAGNGNQLSIADVDAADGQVSTVLSVVSGTLSVTGGGGAIITDDGTNSVTIAGTVAQVNAALASVTYAPTLNFNGADTLTITTNDNGNSGAGGTQSGTEAFVITVNPVNDAPVNSVPGPQATNEDTAIIFSTANGNGLAIADLDSGIGDVTTILEVASGNLTVSTAGTAIIAGDGSGTVTITGTVAEVNAALASVTYTPILHFNGADTLTVTTNDNGNTGSGGALVDTGTVAITVNPVNDAPVNSIPVPQAVNEDTSLVFSAATGNQLSISDVDAAGGQVSTVLNVVSGSLAVTIGGGAIVANDGTNTVTITGTVAQVNAALASVTYTPFLNFNGADTLRVTTDDNGNSGSGGALADTDTVGITVNPVNDAPVITVPGPQATNEDIALVFSDANGNGLAIADLDAGNGDVTTILEVASGTLTVTTAGTATIAGDSSGTVTITGTVFEVNAALAGVTYTPTLNFNGADTLTVTTNDNGNSGSGGALTDTGTVAITVNPVNDAPVNTVPADVQTVAEDTFLVLSTANGNGLSVADVDAANGNVTTTLSVASGTLAVTTGGTAFIAGDGSGTVTITGTVAEVNAALASVTYAPTLNFNGADTLTIATNDNGNSGAGGARADTDSVAIAVSPVNDAPVNSIPGPQTTNEDTNLVFSAGNGNQLSIADLDAAAGTVSTVLQAASGTITVTIGGGAAVTGDGTSAVTITGTVAQINAALASVAYSPTPNFNGADTLTVTTNDNGNTGAGGALVDSDTVAITVNPVNDAPVNSVPGPQATSNDIDLVFSAGNGNLISISDVDAGAGLVTTTLTVQAGSLTPASGSGAAIAGGGTTSVTITGTIAQVNAALSTVTFTPDRFTIGAIALTVTTNDNGNTGADGNLTGTAAVEIQVGTGQESTGTDGQNPSNQDGQNNGNQDSNFSDTPGNPIGFQNNNAPQGPLLIFGNGQPVDPITTAGIGNQNQTGNGNGNGVSDSDLPGNITLDPASDTGFSNSDNTTADNTPLLTGEAPANSIVTITSSLGGVLGTAIADENGRWSFTAPDLSDGEHELIATPKDEDGNEGVPSLPLLATIDTQAPDTPPAPAYDGDAGQLKSNDTPTFRGTAEPGARIVLTSDPDGIVGEVIADENGNWQVTTGPLSENTHSLSITATDAAGNTSPASPTLELVVRSDEDTALNFRSDPTILADVTAPDGSVGFDPVDITALLSGFTDHVDQSKADWAGVKETAHTVGFTRQLQMAGNSANDQMLSML